MTKAATTTIDMKAVATQVQKDLGITNTHAVPRVSKVVVHVGVGKNLKEGKFLETVQETLERITGQKPVQTLAKKSIANFKVREGMVSGCKVTLRGQRMADFLQKMISVALPRVRDFQGISPSVVDSTGNATIGFREHLVFPEISADDVERVHGLEVTIETTATTREEGLALLTALGLPFAK